jgi:hypothetical protein
LAHNRLGESYKNQMLFKRNSYIDNRPVRKLYRQVYYQPASRTARLQLRWHFPYLPSGTCVFSVASCQYVAFRREQALSFAVYSAVFAIYLPVYPVNLFALNNRSAGKAGR